jgi:hypothetical protein
VVRAKLWILKARGNAWERKAEKQVWRVESGEWPKEARMQEKV